MEVYGNNPEMMYYNLIPEKYIREDILDTRSESARNEIFRFERIFYPKLVSMVINRVGVKNIGPFLNPKGTSLTDRNQVTVIMDSISKLALEDDLYKLNRISWCYEIRMLFEHDPELADDKVAYIIKRIKIRKGIPTLRSDLMATYILKRLRHVSMVPGESYSDFDKIMIEALWWTI